MQMMPIALKNRPATLKALLDDIQWALDLDADSPGRHTSDLKADSPSLHTSDSEADSTGQQTSGSEAENAVHSRHTSDLKADSPSRHTSNLKAGIPGQHTKDFNADSPGRPTSDLKADSPGRHTSDLKADSPSLHTSDSEADSTGQQTSGSEAENAVHSRHTSDLKADSPSRHTSDLKADSPGQHTSDFNADSPSRHTSDLKADSPSLHTSDSEADSTGQQTSGSEAENAVHSRHTSNLKADSPCQHTSDLQADSPCRHTSDSEADSPCLHASDSEADSTGQQTSGSEAESAVHSRHSSDSKADDPGKQNWKADDPGQQTLDSKSDDQCQHTSDMKSGNRVQHTSDSKAGNRVWQTSDLEADSPVLSRPTSDWEADSPCQQTSDMMSDSRDRRSSESEVDIPDQLTSDSEAENPGRHNADSKEDSCSSDSEADSSDQYTSDSEADSPSRHNADSKEDSSAEQTIGLKADSHDGHAVVGESSHRVCKHDQKYRRYRKKSHKYARHSYEHNELSDVSSDSDQQRTMKKRNRLIKLDINDRKYPEKSHKRARHSYEHYKLSDESSDSDQQRTRKKRKRVSTPDQNDRKYSEKSRKRARHSYEHNELSDESSDSDQQRARKKRNRVIKRDQNDRKYPEKSHKHTRHSYEHYRLSDESSDSKQQTTKSKKHSPTGLDIKNRDAMSNDAGVQRDINNPKIFVRSLRKSQINAAGKKKKTDRIWDQAHACKFCMQNGQKIVIKTNINKHLRKHKNEKEVQEIIAASQKKEPRNKFLRAKWDLLRNSGDHKNNMNVLAKGKGELVLGRRGNGPLDISDYGPCPNCFIWIRITGCTMVKHQATCPARITNPSEKQGKKIIHILSLELSGKISSEASQALKEEVYTIMTRDEISTVAQADPLIISLGNMWLLKNVGNRLKRKYYTSSHMRGAARLLIHLQKITELKEGFFQLLGPKYFDDIVKATLMTASVDFDDEEDLRSPSTALKMGYDIKRLIGAKWGMALRNDDEESAKECKDLLKLMKFEWNVKVTKLATVILQCRHYNKDRTLPEPDDLFQLQAHIKEEIKKLDLSDSSYKNFRKAEVLAQTRLLMYNKRRAGEVEVIRINDYLRRQSDVSNLDRAMRAELSELEIKLLETQDLMEVRGKGGRGVPVIVPPDVRPVLRYLVSAAVRQQSGVQPSNKYLFPNSSTGVLRAYDSLKSLCDEVHLQKPEKITSVSLRKYTATVSQVFDLSPQQQTWLTNHLGHTLDIHKIHYRQTSGVIERVDMAKIMLLQEHNITSKFAGMKLADIQIPGLLFGQDEERDQSDAGKDAQNKPDEAAVVLEDDCNDPEYQPDVFQKDVHDEFEFLDEEEAEKTPLPHRKPTTRVKWTANEEKEIKQYFKENFKTLITPGRKECMKAIEMSKKDGGKIHLRNWETLKKKVWNMLKKM